MRKKSGLPDKYIEDIKKSKEARYKILIIHLYLEYILDKIIEFKFKKPQKIMQYSFSKKLEILDCLNAFSGKEHLWSDFKKINEVRNAYAHNLDLDNVTKSLYRKIKNFEIVKRKLSLAIETFAPRPYTLLEIIGYELILESLVLVHKDYNRSIIFDNFIDEQIDLAKNEIKLFRGKLKTSKNERMTKFFEKRISEREDVLKKLDVGKKKLKKYKKNKTK